MINGIRKTARVITTTMNFCLNPTCLHADRAKGCACCKRGHGKSKSKTPAKSRKRR